MCRSSGAAGPVMVASKCAGRTDEHQAGDAPIAAAAQIVERDAARIGPEHQHRMMQPLPRLITASISPAQRSASP